MLTSKGIKNIVSLYTATLLSVFVGLGVSIFNARLLGVEAFGDLKFIQLVFNYIIVLIVFGFFNSIARLLTVNERFEKSLYGVFVLITSIISLVGILLVLIFSIINDLYFDNNIGNVIRLSAFFITPLVFLNGLQNILRGSEKIQLISLLQILPQLSYLLLILFLDKLILIEAIVYNYTLLLLIIVIIIYSLKPSFNNIKTHLNNVLHENKIYGKHIYFGSVAALASGQLGGIIIGFFLENKIVGFFALAITVSQPLLMIPSIIGTTFFKQFASLKKISLKIVGYTTLICLFSYLCFYFLLDPVISSFYPVEFIVVVKYAQLIALGSIFHGFGDLYNRFLSSHGKGELIRNGAYVVGVFNVVGYISLIALYGAYGAIITRVASGLVYFLVMFLGYRKYLKLSNL